MSIQKSNNDCTLLCSKLILYGSASIMSNNYVELRNFEYPLLEEPGNKAFGQQIRELLDSYMDLNVNERTSVIEWICLY